MKIKRKKKGQNYVDSRRLIIMSCGLFWVGTSFPEIACNKPCLAPASSILNRVKECELHTTHTLILVAISAHWLTTIHLGKEHVVQTLILVLMPSVFLVISLLFPSLPPPKKNLLSHFFIGI